MAMPLYISPEEAAYLLGVHPRTVRKWCQEGRIPAVRIGPKLWRIPLYELEATLGRMGEEHDGD